MSAGWPACTSKVFVSFFGGSLRNYVRIVCNCTKTGNLKHFTTGFTYGHFQSLKAIKYMPGYSRVSLGCHGVSRVRLGCLGCLSGASMNLNESFNIDGSRTRTVNRPQQTGSVQRFQVSLRANQPAHRGPSMSVWGDSRVPGRRACLVRDRRSKAFTKVPATHIACSYASAQRRLPQHTNHDVITHS